MTGLRKKALFVLAIGVATGVGFIARQSLEAEAVAQDEPSRNAEPAAATADSNARAAAPEDTAEEATAESEEELDARLSGIFDDAEMLSASEKDGSEREIVTAFASPEVSKCSLLAAECRSEMCKVRTLCADLNAERQAFAAIFGVGRKAILPRTGDVLVSKREVGNTGELAATIFIGRGVSVMELVKGK
jgi:hypothetical protein